MTTRGYCLCEKKHGSLMAKSRGSAIATAMIAVGIVRLRWSHGLAYRLETSGGQAWSRRRLRAQKASKGISAKTTVRPGF